MNPFEVDKNMPYEFLDQYSGLQASAYDFLDQQEYMLKQIQQQEDMLLQIEIEKIEKAKQIQQQEDMLLQIEIEKIDKATKQAEAEAEQMAEFASAVEMVEEAQKAEAALRIERETQRVAQRVQADMLANGAQLYTRMEVSKRPKFDRTKTIRVEEERRSDKGEADQFAPVSKVAAAPVAASTPIAHPAGPKDCKKKSCKCKISSESLGPLDGCLPEIQTYLSGSNIDILTQDRVQKDYLRGKAYTVKCLECNTSLLISGKSANSIVLCPNCLALFPARDACVEKQSVIAVPLPIADRNEKLVKKTSWMQNYRLREAPPQDQSCSKHTPFGNSQDLQKKQIHTHEDVRAGNRSRWPFQKRNKVNQQRQT